MDIHLNMYVPVAFEVIYAVLFWYFASTMQLQIKPCPMLERKTDKIWIRLVGQCVLPRAPEFDSFPVPNVRSYKRSVTLRTDFEIPYERAFSFGRCLIL